MQRCTSLGRNRTQVRSSHSKGTLHSHTTTPHRSGPLGTFGEMAVKTKTTLRERPHYESGPPALADSTQNSGATQEANRENLQTAAFGHPGEPVHPWTFRCCCRRGCWLSCRAQSALAPPVPGARGKQIFYILFRSGPVAEIRQRSRPWTQRVLRDAVARACSRSGLFVRRWPAV